MKSKGRGVEMEENREKKINKMKLLYENEKDDEDRS